MPHAKNVYEFKSLLQTHYGIREKSMSHRGGFFLFSIRLEEREKGIYVVLISGRVGEKSGRIHGDI